MHGFFLCCRRLKAKGVQLGAAIAEMLSSETHSISHALLACMPCNEIVTTNYDTLFEQAIASAGKREFVPCCIASLALAVVVCDDHDGPPSLSTVAGL